MFSINEIKYAKGCITQEIYLLVNATSLEAMERLLGFRKGRFAQGVAVGALTQLPSENQFDYAGYNQVATDKIDRSTFLKGMDVPRMKRKTLQEQFSISGTDRLVKVFPVIGHSDNEVYPPGSGIPQWILTEELPFRIIKIFNDYPGGKYSMG